MENKYTYIARVKYIQQFATNTCSIWQDLWYNQLL